MLASPGFRAAAHHALFADRLIPLLAGVETAQAQAEAAAANADNLTLSQKVDIGEQRRVAAEVIPMIRDLLYPED